MTTHTIDSPLPGILYQSPSPGAPPFKSAGDPVQAGDTLAVVEVMKSFIPVEAEIAGTFGRYVAASDAVLEPGDPICEIEV